MIEALILHNDEPIAKIRITRQGGFTGFTLSGEHIDLADYSVEFAVERGTAVGLHTRNIFGFPRRELNVLALLRLALENLDEKELKLERDFDPDAPEAEAPVSADLARRLNRTVREIQAGLSRLHYHRPALRRGQSEQPGGDGGREEVRPEDR